jgi:hypothetical protein
MTGSEQLGTRQSDRYFYIALAGLAAVIVFFGFSRTYYLKRIFGTPQLSLLAHLHGVLFSSWIVLLITQVSLVCARRTDIHRRLGVAGGVLAVFVVCAGIMMSVNAVRRTAHTPEEWEALGSMTIPFFDMVVFASVVAAGFYFRHQPAIHKRLMVVATITILPAAISRIPLAFIGANGPLAFFGLADLLLVACILFDFAVHRRLHPAYVWGGLLLIVSHPLRLFIGGTAAWRAFARCITGI